MITDTEAWATLHDHQTWKIYRARPRGFRYTIADPSGTVVGVAVTLWGAKRALRRALKEYTRPKDPYWWETPLIHRVGRDGNPL